jgi:hypothetical protein
LFSSCAPKNISYPQPTQSHISKASVSPSPHSPPPPLSSDKSASIDAFGPHATIPHWHLMIDVICITLQSLAPERSCMYTPTYIYALKKLETAPSLFFFFDYRDPGPKAHMIEESSLGRRAETTAAPPAFLLVPTFFFFPWTSDLPRTRRC